MIAGTIHHQYIGRPNLHAHHAIKQCQLTTRERLLFVCILRRDGHKWIGCRRVPMSIHSPASQYVDNTHANTCNECV